MSYKAVATLVPAVLLAGAGHAVSAPFAVADAPAIANPPVANPPVANPPAADAPAADAPAAGAPVGGVPEHGRAVTANGSSFEAAISADGRFVAFTSAASNLVAGDTNGKYDVFVRDLKLGDVRRVSVNGSGGQAGDDSFGPSSITSDGRFVAFNSAASNLVAGDTNDKTDVFVRDLKLGTTRRVSVSTTGVQADDESLDPSISADGRFVAFTSAASNLVAGDTADQSRYDVFVRDLKLGTTRRVSVSGTGGRPDNDSFEASISADGGRVAFTSAASNLVAGDTNEKWDVFVRDLGSGTTRRVSVSGTGGQADDFSSAPSISADGRSVGYVSFATNVVAGDTNGESDVFVRDLGSATTRRVSVSGAGGQSAGGSIDPSVSGDGRLVAFASAASNLVTGDTNDVPDVFVRDLKLGTTRRVSVSTTGGQTADGSIDPSVSGDGRLVAFASAASNLVAGDTNDESDVFVRDLELGTTRLVSGRAEA